MPKGIMDNVTMNQTAKPDPATEHQKMGVSIEDMGRHATEAAQFLKQLASPHRLMVLCHLLHGELSVSELNEHLDLSQSALSQHLAVLRHAGLVQTRRQHQVIYYSLASKEVEDIIALLHEQFCPTPS